MFRDVSYVESEIHSEDIEAHTRMQRIQPACLLISERKINVVQHMKASSLNERLYNALHCPVVVGLQVLIKIRWTGQQRVKQDTASSRVVGSWNEGSRVGRAGTLLFVL